MMRKKEFKSSHVRYHLVEWIGILALSVVITLIFFQNYDAGLREFFLSYAWSLVLTATLWIGNSRIYQMLDKRFSWEDHLLKRAVFGSLALIVYSAGAYMLIQVIMFMLVEGSLPENPVAWGLRSSYVAILISFIVSLIFVAMGFFQNWKKSLLEAERIRAEMLMYKYEALQNQINPHFLFNSFNVLSDLVYEDQKRAVHFIRQLSHLFRYVLDSRDKELVPLKDELEFMEAYTYLLQTRFENKLVIRNGFRAKKQEMIVPMTLQLLMENCIKHNEISARQPLQIEISRNGEYIRVANHLQLKATAVDSKKTGLSNIRQQFKFFTAKEILIEQTADSFVVDVPLINHTPQ
jgi:sensor histidine kinase YesM